MVLEAVRREPTTGKAEQLVVLLHGVGADGHDLIDLAVPWTKGLPQAAFLAPHAPYPYDSAPFDQKLRKERGVELIAPHRSNRRRVPSQDGRPLRRYCRRWKIERLFRLGPLLPTHRDPLRVLPV